LQARTTCGTSQMTPPPRWSLGGGEVPIWLAGGLSLLIFSASQWRWPQEHLPFQAPAHLPRHAQADNDCFLYCLTTGRCFYLFHFFPWQLVSSPFWLAPASLPSYAYSLVPLSLPFEAAAPHRRLGVFPAIYIRSIILAFVPGFKGPS